MKVSILTHSFLDSYNGRIEKIYGGGLEKYIYELCIVLRKLQVDIDIHQLAFHQSFVKEIHTEDFTAKVYGHLCTDINNIPNIFHSMSSAAEGKLIYASCIWHAIEYKEGSLGICHGINWDRINLSRDTKVEIIKNIQKAVDQLSNIVTVDSHFLTYCRSSCFYQEVEKIKLIPNFVDTQQFTSAVKKEEGESNNFKILFPRRISHERGIIQMMAASDILLETYPNIVIVFVGEVIDNSEICDVFLFWLSQHPHRDRIVHKVMTFHEMPLAYQEADIAIIPTMYSEGTSLSCLEALSSGLPVVASNVGGLNDLIIDGFNGRLISPTVTEIVEAITELYENDEKRTEISLNARPTSLVFDKKIWRGRWEKVLRTYLGLG